MRIQLPQRHPALVAATIGLLGTLLLIIALPGFGTLLSGWSDSVQFGVLLVLFSGVRVAAGAFAARSLRRRDGLHSRADAVPSVIAGAVAAAVLYALLAVTLGGGVSFVRWLLEIVRWGAEAALGAFVVTPGEPDDETLLRRLDRRASRF